MVFKTLDIRQGKAVIAEKWKSNEMNPQMVPAYYSEKVFRPHIERSWEFSLEHILSWGDRNEIKDQWKSELEFIGQNNEHKKPSRRQNPGDLRGSFWVVIRELINERKLPETKERAYERIRTSRTWYYTDLEIVPVTTSWNGKSDNS